MSRKLIAVAPFKPVLEEYEDVEPKDGEVFVRTEFTACKHGTEAFLFHGEAEWAKLVRDPETGLFVKPARRRRLFPVSLGNMFVGVIEKVGRNVRDFRVGDRIFGHGGAQDTYTLPFSRLRKVPKGMPDHAVVCLDPAEFAFGAVRDGGVRIGDRVAVFGLGAIGLMAVQFARLSGAEVIFAVDPVAARRKLALEVGADAALDPRKSDVALEIKKATGGVGLDVAIEYSGVASALNDAIRSVGYGGTVAEGAVCKPASSDLRMGTEFHWNRVNIISTRACSEPTLDHPRWNRGRIVESAFRLLMEGRLKTECIVRPVVPFAKAPRAYAMIDKQPGKYIKLAFTHP